MTKNFQQTSNTTLKRRPERGSFDRATVNAILDEAFVCHVGFTVEERPFVIPTSYARAGEHILIHGSTASRMIDRLAKRVQVCVTVTLIDGLVLARSAFHHSINYRSVVILGTATKIESEKDKLAAMRAFTEHIIPGRWKDVRAPSEQELKATTVLSLPLTEVSAKIRTGPPVDDEEDYAWNVWAGELPLHVLPGMPFADSRTLSSQPVPDYILRYDRKPDLNSAIQAAEDSSETEAFSIVSRAVKR